MSKVIDNVDNKVKNKIDAYNEVISRLQELLSDNEKDLFELRTEELKDQESKF